MSTAMCVSRSESCRVLCSLSEAENIDYDLLGRRYSLISTIDQFCRGSVVLELQMEVLAQAVKKGARNFIIALSIGRD
jgi:hypothetical protein